MLIQFIIVGRIDSIIKDDNTINIKVPRNYKNEKGEYEDDLLEIKIFDNLNDTVNDYCKQEDIVGVKGRIQSKNILIAEKVTFLSSKSE